MLKIKGSQTDPQGTPNIKYFQELKPLLIFIFCF